MDLPDRLREIDRLPLSAEGRALARLIALLNEAGVALSADEAERVGTALTLACHEARVPTGRVRRLVDPEAAGFVTGVARFMRLRD